MHKVMHIFPEHLVNTLVAQSAKAGRIAKGASVLEIDAVYGFGSRVEKQAKFILALA